MLWCHSCVDENLLEPPKWQGMKLIVHLNLVLMLSMRRAILSLLYASSHRLIKHKDIFNFALLSVAKLLEMFVLYWFNLLKFLLILRYTVPEVSSVLHYIVGRESYGWKSSYVSQGLHYGDYSLHHML
jgi:hypothetical protein